MIAMSFLYTDSKRPYIRKIDRYTHIFCICTSICKNAPHKIIQKHDYLAFTQRAMSATNINSPLTSYQKRLLDDLYYKDQYQYGIQKTFQKVNERAGTQHHIYREQVSRWLKEQVTYQRNLQPFRSRHIKPIVAVRPLHILQVDLIDFSNTPAPGGFRYIMMVVDVFTRYLWALPLTSKSSVDTEAGFDRILQEIRHTRRKANWNIRVCMTDNGSEFQGHFAALLATNNIKHIQSLPYLPQTQGIVERCNKTVKHQLQRSVGGSWRSNLSRVVDQYNRTIHSYHKHKPVNVWATMADHELLDLHAEMVAKASVVKEQRRTAMPTSMLNRLYIGDRVRLKIRKGQLAKYGTNNWSAEIYTIQKIHNPNETLTSRYFVGDSIGYPREDLQRISA